MEVSYLSVGSLGNVIPCNLNRNGFLRRFLIGEGIYVGDIEGDISGDDVYDFNYF